MKKGYLTEKTCLTAAGSLVPEFKISVSGWNICPCSVMSSPTPADRKKQHRQVFKKPCLTQRRKTSDGSWNCRNWLNPLSTHGFVDIKSSQFGLQFFCTHFLISTNSDLTSVYAAFRHVTDWCYKSHQTLWENKHHVSITPFLLLCSFSTCSPCCRRLIPTWQTCWGKGFLSEASSVSRFRLRSRLPPLLFIVASVSTPEIPLRVWISTEKTWGVMVTPSSAQAQVPQRLCHTHPHSVWFSFLFLFNSFYCQYNFWIK